MKFEMWDAIDAVVKLYDELLEPVYEKHSLTKSELDILLFLANNPEYDRAADIIEVRKVAKSHVSVSVNSLLEKGYLKKKEQKENKRDIHLTVTKKADKIIEDGRAAQKMFDQTIMKGFTHEDRKALQAASAKFLANCQQYGGDNR